jgi:SulP family sulfate permease
MPVFVLKHQLYDRKTELSRNSMKAPPLHHKRWQASLPAVEPTAGADLVPAPAFRPADWLFHVVPALDSLRGYSWLSLRVDVFAGLTVAAVAVPQAMAYASIANLPPQFGLYTAIVMTAVGALFDSSRQLINGPTNAISIAVFSALAFVPESERVPAAILLAFLVGLVQTGITLLRLGDLSRYVSQAVVVGFTLGASVLLFLDQLKNLLGLPAHGGAEEHFLLRFGKTMSQIGDTHVPTLAIGLGTIAFVLALRWLGARIHVRFPDLLLAIGLMAAVVWVFDLADAGVRVVGEVPSRLPTLDMPHLSWSRVRDLAGSGLAIALLGLLEALAMAKAIAARTGQKLDINQQCLSEGLANLAGSCFQCFPGSGSLTRSAINVQAGAVSQWSGVFSAAAVAATVLLLAPFAYYIPRAALAGILLLAAWRLVDRRQLLYHLRTTRFDAGIVLATSLAAVFVSVEFCILIGVFLSFLLFVPRAARVEFTELTVTPERVIRERVPADPPCGRILIFALEGELFFGSAPDLERHFESILGRLKDGMRVVVLRLKRVRNPDAVCLDRLERFLSEAAQRGAVVLLCGVRDDLAKVLHTSGLEQRLGPGRIFRETDAATSSTLEAVRQAYDLLGEDLCPTCPRRGESDKEVLYYMI